MRQLRAEVVKAAAVASLRGVCDAPRMCHSDESRPPAPPRRGEVIGHHGRTLTASDGNVFDAYEAHPKDDSALGFVILPDIRGLHTYYKELAVRFAEAGFHTMAFDYFARTAGRGARDDSFDYMPHVKQTTPEGIDADVRACIDKLRANGATTIFTVGFCFGGTNSWRQSATQPSVAGSVGFYGRPDGLLPVLDDVHSPLLMLLGGEDGMIDPASFDPVISSLAQRHIKVDRYVYEGAPHSFFDRSFAEHAEHCSDAWQRILDFTDAIAK